MIKFLDGPAAGVTLLLHRAPLFLRAVRDAQGDWDALDQPDDTPKPEETVVVYRRKGDSFTVHMDRRVKGRRVGEWYSGGEYELAKDQPPDEVLRDNGAWQKWTTVNFKPQGQTP